MHSDVCLLRQWHLDAADGRRAGGRPWGPNEADGKACSRVKHSLPDAIRYGQFDATTLGGDDDRPRMAMLTFDNCRCQGAPAYGSSGRGRHAQLNEVPRLKCSLWSVARLHTTTSRVDLGGPNRR